ncbi:MAG: hypothetical protein QGF25_07270, partial [Candidatus Woesearchaeota archaeon]|nr:hypothetical protein [Candidatus Woesearchaeota archaeon]
YTLKKLRSMTRFELDRVWKGISIHRTPQGRFRGYVLIHPSIIGMLVANLLGSFWQGKVFLPGKRCKNIIAGQEFFQARTPMGDSLFDHEPCLLLDYSRQIMGSHLRDEIRQIIPGLYLGRVYVFGRFVGFFVLKK